MLEHGVKIMSLEWNQLVPKQKYKSKVWKHFGFPADEKGQIIDSKNVVCKLCKFVVAYSGNTSNLTYHLQRSHWELLAESKGTDDKPGSSKDAKSLTQLTLGGTIAQVAPFTQDSVKHQQLVDATAVFICQSLQPINVVDQPSFRNLLKIAEPQFQLPHQTYFTDKVIPGKYRDVHAVVEKQLAAVEKCTMTTDLWTSQHQQRAYISLTVHFVNDEFKLQSRCLQTLEILQDHNASSLKEVLSSCLRPGVFQKKYVGQPLTMIPTL